MGHTRQIVFALTNSWLIFVGGLRIGVPADDNSAGLRISTVVVGRNQDQKDGSPTHTFQSFLLGGHETLSSKRVFTRSLHETLSLHESLESPEDAITNIGMNWFRGGGDDDNIVYHLLKDLDAKTIAKLKACKVKASDAQSTQNKAMKNKAPDVLLVVNAEPERAKDLGRKLPNRSVILGTGHSEEQLEASNIDGKPIKNIWVPYSSLFFLEQTGHSPMELVNRTRAIQSLANKKDDIVYLQNHCVKRRESFWDAICMAMNEQGKTCHYAGKCNGDRKFGVLHESEGGRKGVWIPTAVDTYAPFRFAVSMENNVNDYGYMTEKIVLPLLAGTVPIYSGAKQVTDVFEPGAFVLVDHQNENASINAVQELIQNPDMYERMVSRPVVSEEHFRKHFTWHSSTFAKYGDELRMRIIESILDLC